VLVEIGADVIALVAGFKRQRVEYWLLSLVLFARPACLTSQRWFTSINNIFTKKLFNTDAVSEAENDRSSTSRIY
jgi:hypothetical protein